MKALSLILILFIACVTLSYAQREYSEETQLRYSPTKEIKYRLSKKEFILSDTSIVSSDAVYVNGAYYCGKDCDSSYTFMRFYNDGSVFVSFPYLSFPNDEEISDMSYGKFGHYITDGESVKVELYMNKEHGVMYMFAKPSQMGIQFYKSTGRGLGQILKVSKTKNNGFYKKYSI